MSLTFSLRLDRANLKKSEIQQLFTELAAAGLTPGDVEKTAVTYRNIKQPMKFNLRAKMDPLVLTGVSYGGFYPLSGVELHHLASNDRAENFDAGNQPLVELEADVYMVGCGPAGRPTKACLGGRTAAGTWNVIPGTERPFGSGKGISRPCYDDIVQDHYVGGAALAPYYPINYPTDAPVKLYAMGGGSDGSFDPTLYEYYTVMLNGTLSSTCNGWCWLELNARDSGK